MSHIISLDVENYLRVNRVRIEPDGAVVMIGGDNGEGKSSAISAIEVIMIGDDVLPEEPVHRGKKSSRIILELDDLIARKTIKANGKTRLTVEKKDGTRVGSPQTVLKKLVGELLLDVVAFEGMKPKPRLEALKGLLGLDFTGIEELRAKVFSDRTYVNRQIKAYEATIAQKTEYPDAPEDEVSVADLTTELEKRQDINAKNEKDRNHVTVLEQGFVGHQDSSRKIREQIKLGEDGIARLKERLVAEQKLADEFEKAVSAQKALIDDLVDADEPEIREKLRTVEQTNREVRENRAIESVSISLNDAKEKSRGMTATLDKFDQDKAQAIEDAEFPVPGLSFDEDGVLYNDLPFDQASGAERLRVSIAMGIALNPKFRVLLVKDGSRLDRNNLAVVKEMADKHNMQIWIERVGDGDDCQVIIEDGRVKGAEAYTPEPDANVVKEDDPNRPNVETGTNEGDPVAPTLPDGVSYNSDQDTPIQKSNDPARAEGGSNEGLVQESFLPDGDRSD